MCFSTKVRRVGVFVEEGSVSRAHVTQAVQIIAQSSQSEAKDRMVGTLDLAVFFSF